MTPLDRFVYWIKERESIRLARIAGNPPPWTMDPILQHYRFCNIVRVEDKVSQWLLRNWYTPYHNHLNMLCAVALARFLNKPESLEPITRFVFRDGFPPDWGSIQRTLRVLKNKGPIFSAAYMVRGNDGVDKVQSVVDYNVRPLAKNPPRIDPSSMERTWAALEGRYGFGSFMAGQVIADLRWALDGTWRDRKRWAPLGPGSRRGMNRLLGLPIMKGMTQTEFESNLVNVICTATPGLPRELTERMEAMDWQNCCCEFDKYERVRFGEGRPKQMYRGNV